jgi:Glutathione S-transferase, N-terminal domain
MADSLYIAETPSEVKDAKVCQLKMRRKQKKNKNKTIYTSSLMVLIFRSSMYTEILTQGLHLITMSTPNGQKVQILLEELAQVYGTTWTTTTINIGTNEQKKEWFLRLNPNGRIPVLIDNTQTPPFPVMETSAELLYLLKFSDKEDRFGFKDELERSQCLQWLFFWHGSGAPYQGQTSHFARVAPEKIPCSFLP